MTRNPLLSLLLGAAVLFAGSTSQAIVVFDFNYLDAPGIGFNANGQVGIDRKAGLDQAADYISGILGPAYTASINLDVMGGVTNDSLLASAGSNYNAPVGANGFTDMGDVMLKILNGNSADPAPGMADGEIMWNFEDFSWEPLSDFQPGELDLISTATHEITHALGFLSDINQNGTSQSGNNNVWAPFDQFVAFTDGTPIIDGTTFNLDQSEWDTASIGGTGEGGLEFIGPNALAASGGDPIYLFSSNPWQGGSSGSHLDTGYYDPSIPGRIENMMNESSSFAEGLDVRAYSDLDFAILMDIGYTQIQRIPEPTAATLLVLAAAGLVSRRRS